MPKKYYGAETEKAIKNFSFSGQRVAWEFIYALAQIKKAAAEANFFAGNISRPIKSAIIKAADEVLAGKHQAQFNLPALQGGAGTSINMNVNEVIAARANEILNKSIIHPNDHINRSQSTNDVNPSAIKVASLTLGKNLIAELSNLAAVFEKKSKQFKKISKLARTHMQDAVPTTLGAEFSSYTEILKRHYKKIQTVLPLMRELNLGGTAIGNSANASGKYIKAVYKELNKITREKFSPAKNLMSQTSSQTDFLAVSQAVTALCVDLSKIATDLRLLSSGPRGGFGEITLTELQKGSSIMPGKVNPVLPETVDQLYFLVSGNNLSIEHAAHAAQLELGVMFPIIAERLIQSLKLTAEVMRQFNLACISKITANADRAKFLLENSTAYATYLTPVLGYDAVSAAVKEAVASGKTLREVIITKNLLSAAEFERIIKSE